MFPSLLFEVQLPNQTQRQLNAGIRGSLPAFFADVFPSSQCFSHICLCLYVGFRFGADIRLL
jgi:hypothetical protein